jgi:hypothetical protein
MINFTPKSEEQLAEDGLLEDGIYDFTVLEAVDQQSKKDGTSMIRLKLNLFTTDGNVHLYTYLHPRMEFLIRHFCATARILNLYQTGNLDARACNDRSGRVSIGIEKAKNGFAAKNKVLDFEVPVVKVATETKASVSQAREADDDVAF